MNRCCCTAVLPDPRLLKASDRAGRPPKAVEVPRKLQGGSCCGTSLIQSKGVQPKTCNQYCWRTP